MRLWGSERGSSFLYLGRVGMCSRLDEWILVKCSNLNVGKGNFVDVGMFTFAQKR